MNKSGGKNVSLGSNLFVKARQSRWVFFPPCNLAIVERKRYVRSKSIYM
jgi:hypothetical protein